MADLCEAMQMLCQQPKLSSQSFLLLQWHLTVGPRNLLSSLNTCVPQLLLASPHAGVDTDPCNL